MTLFLHSSAVSRLSENRLWGRGFKMASEKGYRREKCAAASSVAALKMLIDISTRAGGQRHTRQCLLQGLNPREACEALQEIIVLPYFCQSSVEVHPEN